MTATGHALVGVLIATRIQNPLLAIPIAILSHIVGDFMPHWDAGTNREHKSKERLFFEALADVLVGFISVLLFLIFFAKTVDFYYALLIVFASQSLDWLSAPYVFFNIKGKPFFWAYLLQKTIENKLDKPWGIITQAAFVLIVFFITNLSGL
ncbi:hypothetical protein HYT17_03320 [Candidatus Microgenomates bacterium]|nr:hypothetical protein [Candidatus Microgenomates bacterium]